MRNGEFAAKSTKRNIIDVSTREACGRDYSPCECQVYPNNPSPNDIFVFCYNVTVQSIRDAFQRVNDPEIYSLQLSSLITVGTNNTISIPANFLGNTSVTNIDIDCVGDYLVIDPLAFRFSENETTEFLVAVCDLGLQADFSFLNGFEKLVTLGIDSANNITAFQYLPPLPSLELLLITSSPDLNQIEFPDLSPAKLKELQLAGNSLNDETADAIVAKLAASTSADSLEHLHFISNPLTRVPNQVGSAFPRLKGVNFYANKISQLSPSSFAFVPPLEWLNLNLNNITVVESGAFQGTKMYSGYIRSLLT